MSSAIFDGTGIFDGSAAPGGSIFDDSLSALVAKGNVVLAYVTSTQSIDIQVPGTEPIEAQT